MGEFSLWHLIIILVIVLIFFGPQRLPGLGNSIGKAIRGFKEGMKHVNDPLEDEKPARTAHEALPQAHPPSQSINSQESQTQAEKDKNKV
jgi:sec-independent protein translocase protein TatA